MYSGQQVHFTKMHGCGNNYIYVYLPENPIDDLSRAAIEWSRPGFGIGSDGLITIDRSDVADFRMRIFNNDGSEATMCGNGVRCCGKFVRDHHLTERSTVTFDTLAGIKTLQLTENAEGIVTAARVDMGVPVVGEELTLTAADRSFTGRKVSMGNPHFVILLNEDVENFDLTKYGRILEKHEAFPGGCNIEFVNLRKDASARMRVWERGSGITLACGTGACATAAAIISQDLNATKSLSVEMDGGTLQIEWEGTGERLYMTGPAESVFEGTVRIPQQ